MIDDKPEQKPGGPEPVIVTPQPGKPNAADVERDEADHAEAHRAGVEAVERALTGPV